MPSSIRANSTAAKLPAGYVEDLSKGPMLRYQESLPKLPVPTLEETAAKYLRSVVPIVSPSEYARTEAAVKEFIQPGGAGEALQKKLLARAADPKPRTGFMNGGTKAPI